MRKFILILLCILPSFVLGQKWDYPVKSGTDEWKKLNSNQEKVTACQIPSNVLKELTTPELLEICLKYPLINDIYAFNNIYDGLNKLKNDFNGIRELINRKDAGIIILKKYRNTNKNTKLLLRNIQDIEKGEYIILVSTLELLMSYKEIFNNIVYSKQKTIMAELWNCYNTKIQYKQYFKGIGISTNLYSRYKFLTFINPEKHLNKTKKRGYNNQVLQFVNKETLNFIKN